MSLTAVKSQVDQIYLLLRKMLNNQSTNNTQQVDLAPVTNGITQLKTDYLQDVLDKVREQNTKFSDAATGWVPFFNKTEGIRASLFDANGLADAINAAKNKILDQNGGIDAIFNKASVIHTGLFDAATGISARVLDISGSINDNSNGLKSIFDKASGIHTGLFDSVSGLSGKIFDLSSSVENPTDGLKAIKTAINNLYGGGTRDLLDIYNKVDAISTTKYTLTLLEPEIISLNSTFINSLDISMAAITTNKILKFSTIMDGGLFKYNNGLMESGVTSAVEISYTITANFTPLENIKLYFVNTSGTDKAIGIISVSNTVNAPKTWSLNGSIKTSLVTGNEYKIVFTGTETSADITGATFTINQI
jgi:hypothetical protein